VIDPKLLREQPEAVARNLARRGESFDAAAHRELEARRKELQVRSENLRAERNRLSKEVGMAARKGGPVEPLKRQAGAAIRGLAEAEAGLQQAQAALREVELNLPNMRGDSVPGGKDESANRELKVWGDVLPAFEAVEDALQPTRMPGPINNWTAAAGYGVVLALAALPGEGRWRFGMTDVIRSGMLTTASDLLFTGARSGH